MPIYYQSNILIKSSFWKHVSQKVGIVTCVTILVLCLSVNLKELILENVISKVDHKNLNIDTDFMNGIIPTSENIAVAIWSQLENKIPGGRLYSVKLYETENNYFEYKGE